LSAKVSPSGVVEKNLNEVSDFGIQEALIAAQSHLQAILISRGTCWLAQKSFTCDSIITEFLGPITPTPEITE